MCGIVAYAGERPASNVLFNGLKRLEYRGYDSAGVAILNGKELSVCKQVGGVDSVSGCLSFLGNVGIGHTRWATHGKPSKENAHPFVAGDYALVHNGIVENYAVLKEELLARGHKFSSDTDSEVVVHLLADNCAPDPVLALKSVIRRLKGSFALAVLHIGSGMVLCTRRESPLLLGHAPFGYFCASDVTALGECEYVAPLREGDVAVLKRGSASVVHGALYRSVAWKKSNGADAYAEKGEFKHFMLKEIYDATQGVEQTVRYSSGKVFSALLSAMGGRSGVDRVLLLGCGTAYHSALTGALLLTKALALPVETVIASEVKSILPPNSRTLVVAVSQSGETADTLFAVRYARSRGAKVLAVTNTPRSALTRLTKYVFFTRMGVEVGVAATKTYIGQLTAFYLFAGSIKGEKNAFFKEYRRYFNKVVRSLPQIQEIAKRMTHARVVYLLGRGMDYPPALEGSLKMREITCLAGAGIPTGELKHGTLALMDDSAYVIAVVTQKREREKSVDGIKEVSARGAHVVALSPFVDLPAEETLLLPTLPEKYYPLFTAIVLDLLAYYTSVALSLDPDKPRNLAKSVTVR